MIVRKIERVNEERPLRVAAYCRVSTMKDCQEESYETQIGTYERQIREHDGWIFAGIYADYGRTGTSVRLRPAFLRMIDDASAGKIDLILAKSVSRFARNVADCHYFAELLKEWGVCIYFEKERIRTDDPESFLMLGLLAAVAQDESHSIGQNRRLAYERQFEKGQYNLGNNRILGYDCVDGVLVPNQDAWIVRSVFDQYLEGKDLRKIAAGLSGEGVRGLRGGMISAEHIRYMIRNETYAGDKRLQKRPPTDYLTHRPDSQAVFKDYYLSDDHPAIIDRKTWEEVKKLRERRERRYREGIVSGGIHHPFYGHIFCAECGAPFVRRTIKGRGGTYYKAWSCRERLKGPRGNGCRMRIVPESAIESALKRLMGGPDGPEALHGPQSVRICVSGEYLDVITETSG